jgi:hypothetical protein
VLPDASNAVLTWKTGHGCRDGGCLLIQKGLASKLGSFGRWPLSGSVLLHHNNFKMRLATILAPFNKADATDLFDKLAIEAIPPGWGSCRSN